MSILSTQRLLLRRFTRRDWQDLYEYLSDPEVVRYEPYEPFTLRECKHEARYRAKSKSFWAVCLKDTGKVIGSLYLDKRTYGTWEMGYVFNRRFHGMGYATESAGALLEHAFSSMQVRRVCARCSPDNTPSWKLMERLGMRREGHSRETIYFEKDRSGQPLWADTYEYAILAWEWRERTVEPFGS